MFIYFLSDTLQTTTFMSSSSQPKPTSNSSSPNTFSPSSSPPLILAFLAIGLFSAAMAFVFWRRIQGNRGWRLTATIPLNNVDRSLYFNSPLASTDVPKLWDLSNGGNFARGSSQGEKEGEAGLSDIIWVNLMVHIMFFSFFFPFLSSSGFHYEAKKKNYLWAKLHISPASICT